MTLIEQFVEDFNHSIGPDGYKEVCDFFIIFSRFEGSLKKAGFVSFDGRYTTIKWTAFEDVIKGAFQKDRTERLSQAVLALLEHPPKTQVIRDGKLDWNEMQTKSDATEINRLGAAIRGMRNNLFHGGKFSNGIEEDIPRNFALLGYGMIILDEWLSLHDEVKANFLAPII